MAHSGKYIKILTIRIHCLLCMEQYYLQHKEEASLHKEQHRSLQVLDSMRVVQMILLILVLSQRFAQRLSKLVAIVRGHYKEHN